METPLYNALKKYYTDDIYPFHMPGHKQGRGLNIADAMKIDLTEVEGVDNLFNAQGVILQSEQIIAKLFGAAQSFFLVNGSSSGIIAAILATCNPNDKILLARNCHKSAYNGMIFSGAIPIYVEPTVIQPYGLTGEVKPEIIEEKMVKHNIKAVLITSPTYEGFVSDIEKIAEIVHRNNAVLIVDEAHGAHFKFNTLFPKTALEQGADIVIQSVHKTLPSLTQTSLIHVKSNKIDKQRLEQALSMVQTSSPSYILMTSIELCSASIDKMQFETFVQRLLRFRDSLKGLKSLRLLGNEMHKTDLSKILIYCCTKDVTGKGLDCILRSKYKLQVEMSGLNHIVGISTVADTNDGFERFKEALYDIEKNLEYDEPKETQYFSITPEVKMSPREAMFSPKETADIDKCIGKISGEFIVPYPPGIPILAPGEVITEQTVNLLDKYIKTEIDVLGLEMLKERKIKIVK